MILMHDEVTRKNLDHVNKDLICMYVTCETMSSMLIVICHILFVIMY